MLHSGLLGQQPLPSRRKATLRPVSASLRLGREAGTRLSSFWTEAAPSKERREDGRSHARGRAAEAGGNRHRLCPLGAVKGLRNVQPPLSRVRGKYERSGVEGRTRIGDARGGDSEKGSDETSPQGELAPGRLRPLPPRSAPLPPSPRGDLRLGPGSATSPCVTRGRYCVPLNPSF
uniref:Uncharacterized protein n=1 Tax=Rousettus aegyptiacus TaxID=9407 RepID=A0A7J8D6P1_ROUAE|nr:hypothetical protein HJG63_008857 [Rousettus aegyptiacus]